MKTMMFCVSVALAVAVLPAGLHAESLVTDSPAMSSSPTSPGLNYLGPDGEPLPFANHDEIVKFLETAKVIEHRELSSGTTRPLKVKLSRKGVQANAIFRSVEISKRSASDSSGRHQFRDSFQFEVAAYELSRMLGLDNVPPVVRRKFNGRIGSMQLWIEQARSETERIENREQHKDADAVHLQLMSMRVFDNLIHNFDRNTGNKLIDARGKLWWIDHTRSFKRLPALLSDNPVVSCDRNLWQRLNDLDNKQVRQRLKPYLDGRQIGALLERRKKLLRRISDLIAEEGESTVLFDPVEPTASSATSSFPQVR